MGAPLLFLTIDARILKSIREGDEAALAELYSSNWRPISSYILRNNGTVDDAKDMLQEALVVLWERVRSGKFEPAAKLSTFLFATAKYKWMRHLARKRREVSPTLGAEEIADGDPSPLEELVENEQTARVRNALKRLGEPCRTLLLLFYWEERSLEDIADSLGFANANTAKSKKYQCKEALRRLMEEPGER
jgi:RNA polymerase sigma factor (sigma-70 family)